MYPRTRMRRYRRRHIQPLFQECRFSANQLIAPVFVDERLEERRPVESMPGVFRHPVEDLPDMARRMWEKGIRSLLLFGIPASKTEDGASAYAETGVIPQALRAVRKAVPEMVLCTDVCACEYTTHGHCGIVGETASGVDVLNDPSLELMTRIAVSHARAGADIVAPSCMLDGVVGRIRGALDENGQEDTLILAYSTKFSSALYGPFREAADSGYQFGDRSTYQLNPANRREAIRESELDRDEGADILMVKPAGLYLDILSEVAALGLPMAAYQVSGEYAMIRAAALQGWIDERAVVMESLTALRRAGADLLITYFAEQVAGWLNEQ